ncbi:tyrosine-type recombinase/integrase [Paraburkholderia caledonica]|uniref:tyrosine-type recombinase/integrase n=1 Tax=Paraburkholderia caledonica TaxID=134536 RepID=UPI0038BAC77E
MTIAPLANQARDTFLAAVEALPPLPKVIVCEDDFSEKTWSIREDDAQEQFTIPYIGQALTINLMKFAPRIRPLMRYFTFYSLTRKSVTTVYGEMWGLYPVPAQTIETLSATPPAETRLAWPAYRNELPYYAQSALKSFLLFLCDVRFAGWSPQYRDFAARALPTSKKDNYAVVRSGKPFLAVHEESSLVRWIDSVSIRATTLSLEDLELACLVVCSYQFGMRPKQLCLLRLRDVTARQSSEDDSHAVHISFKMLKQKNPTLSRMPLVRKVKREWAELFVALLQAKVNETENAFLFGFESRVQLSRALNTKFDEILPVKGRKAYDLRHSLAQRLVDSGASQEELASALGHSDLTTGLVYFRASASQAELVNKALGISKTFQTVARIAKDRFISASELADLKGEQQVAGMPHGLPVSGIGGCSTGQPSCPFNPVTACYGCDRFMPVSDIRLHEQVLQDFRSVVHLFNDSEKGQTSSPAYMQLQRTIDEVQQVMVQLEKDNEK